MYTYEMENDPVNFLYESNSLEELQNRFQRICENNYCCDSFGIVRKFKKANENSNIQNEFICFENYPKEWMKIYNENKYYLKDPVFTFTQNLSQPLYWHIDRFKDISDEQRKILKECSDFGIIRGTTIPLLPNSKFDSFLTLLGTNIHDPMILFKLASLANVYFVRRDHFMRKNSLTRLTPKEQEIFELKIAGYHNKKIAQILSKKNETIALHLTNIRKKFDVLTTEQALVKYYKEIISE